MKYITVHIIIISNRSHSPFNLRTPTSFNLIRCGWGQYVAGLMDLLLTPPSKTGGALGWRTVGLCELLITII